VSRVDAAAAATPTTHPVVSLSELKAPTLKTDLLEGNQTACRRVQPVDTVLQGRFAALFGGKRRSGGECVLRPGGDYSLVLSPPRRVRGLVQAGPWTLIQQTTNQCSANRFRQSIIRQKPAFRRVHTLRGGFLRLILLWYEDTSIAEPYYCHYCRSHRRI